MKIKHYSVLQLLLQDLVGKTAFKKRGLLMSQLSATLVFTMLHTAEYLKCQAFNKYQVCCLLICLLFNKDKIN